MLKVGGTFSGGELKSKGNGSRRRGISSTPSSGFIPVHKDARSLSYVPSDLTKPIYGRKPVRTMTRRVRCVAHCL
jgi:hypothetical protein